METEIFFNQVKSLTSPLRLEEQALKLLEFQPADKSSQSVTMAPLLPSAPGTKQ
jgi:hypothetical protein